MAYGMIFAEKMSSTTDGALLVSAQKSAAVENGQIVKIGALVSEELDLYVASDIAANTDEVYIVDGVEVVYSEETTKGLDDFINAADTPFRARKPQKGDIFSISEDDITALAASTVVVGNYVETPASGTKLVEKATSLTAGVSFGAKIIARYQHGTRDITMVRVRVEKVLA